MAKKKTYSLGIKKKGNRKITPPSKKVKKEIKNLAKSSVKKINDITTDEEEVLSYKEIQKRSKANVMKIELPSDLEAKLNKFFITKIMLNRLHKGAGRKRLIFLAKTLDILTAPLANIKGADIQWKKFRNNGFVLVIVASLLQTIVIGNAGWVAIKNNSLEEFNLTHSIIGQILCLMIFSVGLMCIAGSLRIKVGRSLTEIIKKSVDFAPTVDKDQFLLKLGDGPQAIALTLKDLHTNVGSFGGIGTGKTQAVMNPLLDQMFKQLNVPEPTEAQKELPEFKAWHKNSRQKCGALILDQKGDFLDFVIYTMLRYGRPLEDLVIIDPGLDLYCYNPLDPTSTADDNANKLSQVQQIISGGGGSKDKFWDDASKNTVRDFLQLLELIKPKAEIGLDDLARYIREDELAEYLCDEAERITNEKFEKAEMSAEQRTKYLDTVSNARNTWVNNSSDNVKSTLKITISQLLGEFASDPRLQKVFCRNTNFDFKQLINQGKVVLFRGTSVNAVTAKVLCVLLKLDFQTWAKRRNGGAAKEFGLNTTRTCLFFADEFQEFITKDDGDFFGVARSAKVAGFTATQSISSYYKALGDEKAVDLFRQNVGTWIFLRTTDPKTAELGELLSGQAEVEQLSTSITTGGLVEQAANMGTGHQAKGGEYNVSTQLKAVFRKDDFMRLNTVDGGKAKTGPYYSEAIVYHYHDTDVKSKTRCYKTRLRHIYDIDKDFDNAYKAGKLTQNTVDFNTLMFDRHAQIKVLERVIPAINTAWNDNEAAQALNTEQGVRIKKELDAIREKERKEKEALQKKINLMQKTLGDPPNLDDLENKEVADLTDEELILKDISQASTTEELDELKKEAEEKNMEVHKEVAEKELALEKDSLKTELINAFEFDKLVPITKNDSEN